MDFSMLNQIFQDNLAIILTVIVVLLVLLIILFTKSIQKVAVHRFCAFADMGGDLSYAVALLDNQNNGVIFSSIFGRQDSCTYVKPI